MEMNEINEQINAKAKELVEICKDKKVTVGFAESLTGGMISSEVVGVPGASAVFSGSVVSYTNEVKNSVINVSKTTLAKKGAVSLETALEMAKGVREVASMSLAMRSVLSFPESPKRSA